MSTRCQIEFYWEHPQDKVDAQPQARICKHSDGYPEGVIPMLEKLYAVLAVNIPSGYGPRTDDAEMGGGRIRQSIPLAVKRRCERARKVSRQYLRDTALTPGH
jgi:hypothetical protein